MVQHNISVLVQVSKSQLQVYVNAPKPRNSPRRCQTHAFIVGHDGTATCILSPRLLLVCMFQYQRRKGCQSPRRQTHRFAPTPITMIGSLRPSANASTSSGTCLAANIPPPPMTRALNWLTCFAQEHIAVVMASHLVAALSFLYTFSHVQVLSGEKEALRLASVDTTQGDYFILCYSGDKRQYKNSISRNTNTGIHHIMQLVLQSDAAYDNLYRLQQ